MYGPLTPSAEAPVAAARLRVRGQVQGVGFRPTVWRLAQALGLAGEVRNDGQGVLIEIQGPADAVRAFPERLHAACPPLARIDAIDQSPLPCRPREGFRIAPSADTGADTPVTPDAAICPACLAEIRDPTNRRYRHPFANCTHCGPRLSIVRAIPYDRAHTAMADFPMCDACRDEYQDPADRRFHAQPVACPECGPRLWFQDEAGTCHEQPLARAVALLRAGGILALKGIGGFHLMCDATSPEAVARLRERKRRPAKPLALMARDIEQIRAHVPVSDAEAALLASPEAPIVLLDKGGCKLPEALAPGQDCLGFMLPTSPLHALLLDGLSGPVVATSGNVGGLPPCTDNDQALARLRGIADGFLLHDRPILNRVDDSLARLHRGQVRLLRRARGYAPAPLPLPPGLEDAPPLLAMGGELKNTFCLLHQGRLVLSQHIGDLENAETLDDYRHNLALFQRLFRHRPEAVAVDRHPEYLATKLGRERAAAEGLALIEVQHHHAHLAACLAEHGLPLKAPPVLGIVLDGLGYGDDDQLWGGELLLADYRHSRRLGGLLAAPLPGGAQAMRQPWRNLVAQLRLAFGDRWREHAGPLRERLASVPADALDRLLQRGLQSPPASSAGRLFDAVAAALGLAFEANRYEGEAAMRLEALARSADAASAAPYALGCDETAAGLQVDPRPLWPALLQDLADGRTPALIAWRFHAGLGDAFATVALRAARRHQVRQVVLGGGVLQNRLLSDRIADRLQAAGLEVLQPARVPANDGGLALGQAVIAAAQLLSE